MFVNQEKCSGCGLCLDCCPVGAISERDGQVNVSEDCVNTLNCTCRQICPMEAIERSERDKITTRCINCPVGCEIKPGKMGECRMYINRDGMIERAVPLTPLESVIDIVGEECDEAIRRPLLTGIGAGFGTTSRKGLPRITVQDKVHGVDVVTCVSECHFLYSGVMVKVDCEKYIGEEGAEVYHKGTHVGMVTQELYGAKTIYIGGVNRAIDKNGWLAARLTSDISNRRRVELNIKGGAKIELQVGQKPVVNGELAERRRWCCGATSAVYLRNDFLAGLVDEVIVIDRHNAGHAGVVEEDIGRYGQLFGNEKKAKYGRLNKSGICLHGTTPYGDLNYPGPGGTGWGMTQIQSPLDVIESFDPKKLKSGFRLLVAESDADRVAYFILTPEGRFIETELPRDIVKGLDAFRLACEEARVSAYFTPCASGSARHAVVAPRKSLRLNEAIRDKKACITVAGAPVTVLTGGGVAFLVDVERVKEGSFHWTNTPAVVAPLEWTMKLTDYIEIGGLAEYVRPLKEVLGEMGKKSK